MAKQPCKVEEYSVLQVVVLVLGNKSKWKEDMGESFPWSIFEKLCHFVHFLFSNDKDNRQIHILIKLQ